MRKSKNFIHEALHHSSWWALLFFSGVAVIPGFSSAFAVLLGHPFSYAAEEVQTSEIARTVIQINIVALFAFLVGGFGGAVLSGQSAVLNTRHYLSDAQIKARFIFYLTLAAGFGTLASFSFDGTIFDNEYNRGAEPLFGIGIYSVFAVFALAAAFNCTLYERDISYAALLFAAFIAVYVLVWCLLLRGTRLDAAGLLVALAFFFWLDARPWTRAIIMLAIVSLIYLMFQWGSYRAVAACSDVSFFEAIFTSRSNLVCPDPMPLPLGSPSDSFGVDSRPTPRSIVPSYFSNIGDIAHSQYQVVYALNTDMITFARGKSYLDYFERLLPSIWFEGRPSDFSIEGMNLGGGSLHFLSEAYANFGLFAVFVKSAIIGLFVQLFANGHRLRLGFFWSLGSIFLVVLIFRGLWYQFFSIVKSVFYWGALEFFLCVSAWFLRGARHNFQRFLRGLFGDF